MLRESDRDIVIRRASTDDIDSVADLTEDSYRSGGFLDVEGGEDYAIELRDVGRRIRQAVVLVAEVDGVPVASVTLAEHGTPLSEIAMEGEVEIRMLAVAASMRRRGIAERLMMAAMEYARSRGLTGIVLSTEPPMHSAQRLYQRLGYQRAPERDWTIDGFELLVFDRPVE